MKARLCVGITGHRQDDPLFADRREQIAAAVAHVFELIARAVATEARESRLEPVPVRMHGLLADGTDQLAAQAALELGWELVAPLPFGLALAAAISAQPRDEAEARALLEGDQPPEHPAIRAEARERARQLRQLAARARLFELADSDHKIIDLLLARLADRQDARKAAMYEAEISLRAALASRVVVEQSDFLVAVWDGVTRAAVGGTGHTIQLALEAGAAVVWIDASEPARWRFLAGPEALADVGTRTAAPDDAQLLTRLGELVRMALRPAPPRGNGLTGVGEAKPGAELPGVASPSVRGSEEDISGGSAISLLSAARTLPGRDLQHIAAIEAEVLQRFACSDGLSARLANAHRRAMMAGWLLGACAVSAGAAYLQWDTAGNGWLFASLQAVLLAAVLALAATSRRRRWYRRWREVRRVAEYLRHACLPLLLGVARPAGRWPVGMHTSWPEWHARQALREPGLPRLAITPGYLQQAVRLLQQHVEVQFGYCRAKARHMAILCRFLDRLCAALLVLAILAIAIAGCLLPANAFGEWPAFFAATLPAFAGAAAGIRHFGDYERLAEISSVTAEKLRAIGRRAGRLLAAQDGELDYGRAAHLAHALEEVVVSDLESWQPVFGGSDITLPL